MGFGIGFLGGGVQHFSLSGVYSEWCTVPKNAKKPVRVGPAL